MATPNPTGTAVFRYFDVTDYGAVGNGTTDDATAIQNAINAAANTANVGGGVGAVVFFPFTNAGYLINSTLNVTSNLALLGASNTTKLLAGSATADMINCVDAYGITIENLGFGVKAGVTRTGGYMINHGQSAGVSTGGGLNIRNVIINNAFNAVNLSGTSDAAYGLQIFQTANDAIVVDSNTNSQALVNCVITSSADRTSGSGIHVKKTGDMSIVNCDVIRQHFNLFLDSSLSTAGIFSIYAANCFFDSASSTGSAALYANGSVGAINRCRFVQCWFSSSYRGVYLNSTLLHGIHFENCDFSANTVDGITAAEGTDWTIANSTFAGNASAGINVGQGATPGAMTFQVLGNLVGNYDGWPGAQPYGVYVNPGTYKRYMIKNNIIAGNTTANLSDLATAWTAKDVSGNL